MARAASSAGASSCCSIQLSRVSPTPTKSMIAKSNITAALDGRFCAPDARLDVSSAAPFGQWRVPVWRSPRQITASLAQRDLRCTQGASNMACVCIASADVATALNPQSSSLMLMRSYDCSERVTQPALEVLDQAESTSTLVGRRAALGEANGLCVLAEFQSAGRGRLGRSWHSGLGGALTFSLLWRFDRAQAISAGSVWPCRWGCCAACDKSASRLPPSSGPTISS